MCKLIFKYNGKAKEPVITIDKTAFAYTVTVNAGDTIQKPALSQGSTAVIDWGDGVKDSNDTHTFATAGNYTIQIIGNSTYYSFENKVGKEKLVKLLQWGTNALNSVQFIGCTNLIEVPSTLPKSIVDTKKMFQGCTLFNWDISGWEMQNIEIAYNMFDGATAFNQPIGNWSMHARDMSSMFNDAKAFNQPLYWSFENAEILYGMFKGAISFNSYISLYQLSDSCRSLGEMFYGATSFNQDISNWRVSYIEDMSLMFYGATSFNQDISNWDVSRTFSYFNFAAGSALTQTNTPIFTATEPEPQG
jgi:surface protein